jgi:hypothetical protein
MGMPENNTTQARLHKILFQNFALEICLKIFARKMLALYVRRIIITYTVFREINAHAKILF